MIGKIPFKSKKGFLLPNHRFTGPYNPLHLQLDSIDNPLPGTEQYNAVDAISSPCCTFLPKRLMLHFFGNIIVLFFHLQLMLHFYAQFHERWMGASGRKWRMAKDLCYCILFNQKDLSYIFLIKRLMFRITPLFTCFSF